MVATLEYIYAFLSVERKWVSPNQKGKGGVIIANYQVGSQRVLEER